MFIFLKVSRNGTDSHFAHSVLKRVIISPELLEIVEGNAYGSLVLLAYGVHLLLFLPSSDSLDQ